MGTGRTRRDPTVPQNHNNVHVDITNQRRQCSNKALEIGHCHSGLPDINNPWRREPFQSSQTQQPYYMTSLHHSHCSHAIIYPIISFNWNRSYRPWIPCLYTFLIYIRDSLHENTYYLKHAFLFLPSKFQISQSRSLSCNIFPFSGYPK